MTVAECSLMSCVWACFPDRSPHYTWTALNFSVSRMFVCLSVICAVKNRYLSPFRAVLLPAVAELKGQQANSYSMDCMRTTYLHFLKSTLSVQIIYTYGPFTCTSKSPLYQYRSFIHICHLPALQKVHFISTDHLFIWAIYLHLKERTLCTYRPLPIPEKEHLVDVDILSTL